MKSTSEIVLEAMRAHEPAIDWQYEWLSCSCGWQDPTKPGPRRVRDGSRDWYDHQRRAVRKALKRPRFVRVDA